jgi:hypothetical protein
VLVGTATRRKLHEDVACPFFDDRKAFMSNCLKAAPAANDAKTLTPQQEKMKTCNADAATKALKGDARKAFMSDCLKKK